MKPVAPPPAQSDATTPPPPKYNKFIEQEALETSAAPPQLQAVESVDRLVVSIAYVTVGMRLLQIWALSRSTNRPDTSDRGLCAICCDAAADTLLMPCRHLVLCEVRFRHLPCCGRWLMAIELLW